VTRKAAVGCAPALLGALDFGFFVLAAPALAAELDLGSAYGWLFSAGSLAYGAVVMPAATLLSRVAATRLLAAGLTLAAAGTVLVASAGGIGAALVGRIMFGAGTGAAAAPALVLLAGERAAASFARMGGAIALGFSSGILLGAADAWRTSLVAVALVAIGPAVAAATMDAPRPQPRGDGAGAIRVGTATAASGAAFALIGRDAAAAALAAAAAAELAASGWRAIGGRLRGDVLVACAAGGATTMSGVSAMVMLGLQLTGTPSTADDLALALFGAGTLGAVGVARRLGCSWGPHRTALGGLVVQAGAILVIALVPSALVPSVVLFGAAHVVANAGAAAGVMRHAEGGSAGLYATAQYLAAGAGPLIVLSAGPNGLVLAGAIALTGAAVVTAGQRRPLTQSARRSP